MFFAHCDTNAMLHKHPSKVPSSPKSVWETSAQLQLGSCHWDWGIVSSSAPSLSLVLSPSRPLPKRNMLNVHCTMHIAYFTLWMIQIQCILTCSVSLIGALTPQTLPKCIIYCLYIVIQQKHFCSLSRKLAEPAWLKNEIEKGLRAICRKCNICYTLRHGIGLCLYTCRENINALSFQM